MTVAQLTCDAARECETEHQTKWRKRQNSSWKH
jgi:hypothetical protein